MKKTIFITALACMLMSAGAYAQQITFGIIRNCTSYTRPMATDELNKKHFTLIDKNYQKAQNPLLKGATYYSNETDRTPDLGEVAILSQINGSKVITEFSFISGTKNNSGPNFDEVYKQMSNFFKDERTFKSPVYNVDVNYFVRDKVYYYIYKLKDTPVIVVANYKLEEDYFGKK